MAIYNDTFLFPPLLFLLLFPPLHGVRLGHHEVGESPNRAPSPATRCSEDFEMSKPQLTRGPLQWGLDLQMQSWDRSIPITNQPRPRGHPEPAMKGPDKPLTSDPLG